MSNTANTAKSDVSTETELFSDIVDNYRKADKGNKARIRTEANKSAMSTLLAGNFAEATKWANTVKALKSDKPDIEVNHGQIAANALNVLNAATVAIQTYMVEHDITDLPDAEDNSDKADKLAKSLLSVKSDRQSIDGVFERAFEGLEVGSVLKVSAICAKGATPDYTPGSGAVAARLRGDAPQTLTSDCTLANVEPVWVNADGTVAANWSPSVNVGARKTA